MGAVGFVARSDLRRHWRGTIAITLLVGIVGTIVLATVAGARRSDSALARFNSYSRAANVELSLGEATPAQLRAFNDVPEVESVAAVRTFAIESGTGPLQHLAIGAAVDSKLGGTVDRARLISGRRANLSAPNEVTIGEGLAAQTHLGVGDQLTFPSYTQPQVALFIQQKDGGLPRGPEVRLRIVGIVRRPLDLGDRGASGGVVVMTPAFMRAYSDRIGSWGGPVLRVRARGGDAGVAPVVAAARRIFGKSPFFAVQGLAIESEGARNAINVLTVALFVFAGVSALAGIVAIAIVLNREIALSSSDDPTLRALGSTRRQCGAMNGARALIIASGGALLAALGAVAASPFFPLGVARRADPDVGVHVDWSVLAIGVFAIGLLVAGITVVAATRTARQSSLGLVPRRRSRASTMVDFTTRTGLAPTATTGLRMAIEPGRGETAVPLRSAFLGVVLAVVGVGAAVVFASSLGRLVSTPRMYGWTWDFQIEDSNTSTCDANNHGIARDHAVAALAAVCYENVEVDGRPVTGWGFVPIRGTIGAETVSGHDPSAPNEVALGSVTLHALHKHIGDVVRVSASKGPSTYRIVGTIVLPRLGDPQPLADGAVFTHRGLAAITNPADGNFSRYLLGEYAGSADRAAFARRVGAISRNGQPFRLGKVVGPAVPVEVDRVRQIRWFPAVLASLLGALGLAAVGHALITGVRRRRRDLAVLKTLGFDRRQVRTTVAWQATTLAAVGLLVGLPLGIVVGNLAWRFVADGLGVSTATVTPALVLLALPVVIVALNLVAFFPANAAARARPAIALQVE